MDHVEDGNVRKGAHTLLDRSRVGNYLSPAKRRFSCLSTSSSVSIHLTSAQRPTRQSGSSLRRAGAQIPELADKLGVKVTATYVPMNNHMVFAAVEGDDMATVREFAFQSRLGQWNTIDIYQVATLEEALTKVNELPTIYA
jgi:uncharacterized protein with GYD domain